MVIFVDTSAIFAFISERDCNHESARKAWNNFSQVGELLISNSYILVECIALLQSRLGLEAVELFQAEMMPCLQIEWLDADQHDIAINNVLSAHRRNLSLVDCSAFETMRRLGIDTVFTFDPHFAEQGFNVIP
ncbi:MAG: PIN domain-containing protein [Chloroflexi bacterium]|nr:PIN domain-containing protein [Chloroflexota bacterium]